jgi:hypothetical protein
MRIPEFNGATCKAVAKVQLKLIKRWREHKQDCLTEEGENLLQLPDHPISIHSKGISNDTGLKLFLIFGSHV